MKKYIAIWLVLVSIVVLTSCNGSKDKENVDGAVSDVENMDNSEIENNIELENSYIYGNSLGNFQNHGYANYYNGLTYFSKEDGIYTIDDLGETKKLIDVYEPFGINIVSDKIIFGSTLANEVENEPVEFISTLYTVDINGENIEEILAVEYIMDIMVCNDKVYFIEDKAMTTFLSNGRLNCINVDGSNKIELINGLESTSYIEKYFILDNNIYYLQGDYNPKDDRLEPYEFTLKKLDLATMKTSTLISELDRAIYFDESNVYLKKINESEQIYKYTIKNGDISEVDFVNEISAVNAINYNDKNVFFVNDEGLFKISKDTLEEKKLEYSMNHINDVLIADNWLFVYGYGDVEYYNIDDKQAHEELEKTIKDDDVTHVKPMYIIEHSATLFNNTNKVIDEVYLVRGEDSKLLISNMQPNSNEYVTWNYEERFLLEEYNSSLWGSPYFLLVIDGEKIPVVTAKSKINEDDGQVYINEQLYVTTDWVNYNDDIGITSDTIAFFEDDGENYYYSPQYDYLTKIADENVNYLYIPQLESWLRQRDNQVLFASSLDDSQFEKYFPYYEGELPKYETTAVITTEPIYLEDVSIEADSDYSSYSEVYNSDKTRLFTPNDVMAVSSDSVRNYELYFKFIDENGEVHREYVGEELRDKNNNGIVMCIVGEDDRNIKLID